MNTVEDVIVLLRRLFHGGRLRRMPKKQQEADVIMALSLLGLDPGVFLEETDINVHLSAWLDDISSDAGLDYVTLRRYLVDCGFLRRATDGAIYRICPERIDAVLPPGARDINPKQVFAEVQTARDQRKQQFLG